MGKSCCYDRNLRDWWSYGRNLRQWWKLIWLSVAIPRHAFINWFAITNRLATQDILLKWGYKGDSLRLLQAHFVWVFQKNLERSYEEVLIRKPEFEMVQTCWMGFAWSEGEKSKLCKLVWGLLYIMFCVEVMLGYWGQLKNEESEIQAIEVKSQLVTKVPCCYSKMPLFVLGK